MSSFRSSSLVRTAFSADMALIINNVPPIFIVKAVSVVDYPYFPASV
jgi:hypothetical protein